MTADDDTRLRDLEALAVLLRRCGADAAVRHEDMISGVSGQPTCRQRIPCLLARTDAAWRQPVRVDWRRGGALFVVDGVPSWPAWDHRNAAGVVAGRLGLARPA